MFNITVLHIDAQIKVIHIYFNVHTDKFMLFVTWNIILGQSWTVFKYLNWKTHNYC